MDADKRMLLIVLADIFYTYELRFSYFINTACNLKEKDLSIKY